MRIVRIQVALAGLFALASISNAQPTAGNCPVFPADSIWNTRVDQLPVHPSSSTWVNTIGSSKPVHPDFGSGTYGGGPIGIPFIFVPGSQTKYPATFQYQDESDTGPYAVPLNAPIEGGSSSTGDRHAIALDTDNCILYEIYDAHPQSASWQGGSGAIFHLQSHALRPATWTSADAAGLPIFPGLVRYDEVAAGEIRHAIRFTVPQTQKAYVWPARHYASSLTGAQYPPMGARFRLKASFDISHFSAANQIILTALKRYGMILADNGSSWYLSGAPDARWNNDDLHALTGITGSAFEAVDVSPLMVDPNSDQAGQTSVSVTVSPSSASVAVNATRQFSATVTGSEQPGGDVGCQRKRRRQQRSWIHRLDQRPVHCAVDCAVARNGCRACNQPGDAVGGGQRFSQHHDALTGAASRHRHGFSRERKCSNRPEPAVHSHRSEQQRQHRDLDGQRHRGRQRGHRIDHLQRTLRRAVGCAVARHRHGAGRQHRASPRLLAARRSTLRRPRRRLFQSPSLFLQPTRVFKPARASNSRPLSRTPAYPL